MTYREIIEIIIVSIGMACVTGILFGEHTLSEQKILRYIAISCLPLAYWLLLHED